MTLSAAFLAALLCAGPAASPDAAVQGQIDTYLGLD